MSWSDEVRTPNFDKHRTATSTPQPAGLKSVKPVSLMREIDARLRRAFVRTACKAIEASGRGEPLRFAGATSGHRRCTRSPASRLAFSFDVGCDLAAVGLQPDRRRGADSVPALRVADAVASFRGWVGLHHTVTFQDASKAAGLNANATFRGSGASERRLAAAQRVPTTLPPRQYQGRSSPHVPQHHPAAGSHVHQWRCHRASPTRYLEIGDPDSGQ